MASRIALAAARDQPPPEKPGLRPAPQRAKPKRAMGRPPGADSDARRRLLVATAMRVFACRGFEGATLQEVADDAGVTRPAVHYYFAGKARLYEAALERAHEVVIAPWSRRWSSAPPSSFSMLDPLLDEHTWTDEFRWASALLGNALAHQHRTADITPAIADIAHEVERLCTKAVVGHTAIALAVDTERSAERLAAMIIGRWVLSAAALPRRGAASSGQYASRLATSV
ncbi:TetR/AcrR family transcriptional regulator [Mycolicibacterium sp. CBM1]